jgi:hypothetical protein
MMLRGQAIFTPLLVHVFRLLYGISYGLLRGFGFSSPGRLWLPKAQPSLIHLCGQPAWQFGL